VFIIVFSGTVKKIFGQRWLSPRRKKLARMPMPKYGVISAKQEIQFGLN